MTQIFHLLQVIFTLNAVCWGVTSTLPQHITHVRTQNYRSNFPKRITFIIISSRIALVEWSTVTTMSDMVGSTTTANLIDYFVGHDL